jgi:S1-C subfamily serine protease
LRLLRNLSVGSKLYGAFALVAAVFVLQHMSAAVDRERGLREAAMRKVDQRLAALEARNASLSGRLGSTEAALRRRDGGVARLARRSLRSVFTVETNRGLGSGFVAWRDSAGTYVLTANHVVSGNIVGNVTLTRRGRSWMGEVAAQDPANDLALIRLDAKVPGAAPLWQHARGPLPQVGQHLVVPGTGEAMLVAKTGPSPLPDDERVYVTLQPLAVAAA